MAAFWVKGHRFGLARAGSARVEEERRLRSFRSAEFELGHHDLFSAASLLALVID